MKVEQAVPESRQMEAFCLTANEIRNKDNFVNDIEKRWLMFVSNRTINFFDRNTNIFATKSDKGGHTVIIDMEQYKEKLDKLLNVKDYERVGCQIHTLIRKEKGIINMPKKKNETKHLFQKLPLFEPETLLLPKFYGLVKIHKPDAPLRPITATIGSVGYLLAKVFHKMLEFVFPRTDYHIRDTYEFVRFLSEFEIKESDVLTSFDVVAMYTSIPYHVVESIIMEGKDTFLDMFGMRADEIRRILHFLLKECTFFTALDESFRQVNGLPMGSCISPTLARITMDKVVDRLLREVLTGHLRI